MQTKVYQTASEGCKYVAEYIIELINSRDGKVVLGLPTGSSPEAVYAYLVEAYREGRVSFKNVITFNMDEYVGLGPEDEQSYHYFMNHHLFDHIDIDRANIHILDGQAQDVAKECAEYEQAIVAAGGIDLFLGGIGPNGHIAFNEVGSTQTSVTRQIQLEESTIDANARFFESADRVPRSALSVGISTVLAARQVIILAFGRTKALAVKNSLQGPISSDCPGSFMRLHDQVQFVVDEAAYSRVAEKTAQL